MEIGKGKGLAEIAVTIAIVAAGFLVGTWLKNKMGLANIVGA